MGIKKKKRIPKDYNIKRKTTRIKSYDYTLQGIVPKKIKYTAEGRLINFLHTLDCLTKLATGELWDNDFFNCCCNRKHYLEKYCPRTWEDAHNRICNAYWIEKEDVKQFILMKIFKFRITSNADFYFFGKRLVRDYLYANQVFNTPSPQEIKAAVYQEEIEEINSKIDFSSQSFIEKMIDPDIFSEFRENNIPRQYIYLLFLKDVLEYDYKEISNKLLINWTTAHKQYKHIINNQDEITR
jgi:hypothetical protein